MMWRSDSLLAIHLFGFRNCLIYVPASIEVAGPAGEADFFAE